jgi:hypothetical protein
MKRVRLRGTIRAGLIISSLLVAAAVTGQASALSYLVHRTIGKGSVTGFIKTDGATGILAANDFLDWNLLLSDGSNTFRLTGPLSGNNSQVLVTGMDVGAFNNLLMFNFSGIDYGTLLFTQPPFNGAHYYCDSSQPYLCIPGETVAPLNDRAGYQNVRWHGNVVIGTLDSVPEPGTLGLLFIGGSLFGWRVRSFPAIRLL